MAYAQRWFLGLALSLLLTAPRDASGKHARGFCVSERPTIPVAWKQHKVTSDDCGSSALSGFRLARRNARYAWVAGLPAATQAGRFFLGHQVRPSRVATKSGLVEPIIRRDQKAA